jgi:plasmid maintenance system antidote protein VapI
MTRKAALKAAIYALGLNQQEVAALVGVTALCLTKIITGRRAAEDDLKEALAVVLKTRKEVLFPGGN